MIERFLTDWQKCATLGNTFQEEKGAKGGDGIIMITYANIDS